MEILVSVLTIIGTIFTAIITSYLLVTKMIRTERDLNISQGEQIKTLFINNKYLDAKINSTNSEIKDLLEKRMKDNIEFSQALAMLNNTLTKVNTTLELFNETIKESMKELHKRVDNHENKLTELHTEVKLKKA